MSEISVHYKCCCGAEISFTTDQYRGDWISDHISKFSDQHLKCTENRFKHTYDTPIIPFIQAATNGGPGTDTVKY
jgi:hypothetical protein